MFASVTSVTLVGVEPQPVRVEVHLAPGQPSFGIVGLPDTAVREARERVKAAILQSGFAFPSSRVVVNLSPADLPKAGSAYDLPMALGVLAVAGAIGVGATRVVALGELALDGAVRPVRGGLGAAIVASERGVRCLLPAASAAETSVVPEVEVAAVTTLAEAVAAASGAALPPVEVVPPVDAAPLPADLAEVRGQAGARRALEVAAAGGHHLLLTGPPGAGKTMLARCLPGILPPLTDAEAMEVALAWGAAGRRRETHRVPPFRAPHHSATMPAVVGGGSGVPVPGEITLAHRGVLFLDELGEFPATLLDGLRQPIEEGMVTVARKGASVRFPSRVQLVAATNPCPCGYQDDRLVACRCTPSVAARYRRRFSGPLLDRFDLRIRVGRLSPDELAGPAGDDAATVRGRVVAARKRQQARGSLNAELTRGALDTLDWEPEGLGVLKRAVVDQALSGRGWDRVRRVARTIADLDESETTTARHVAEALRLRGAS